MKIKTYFLEKSKVGLLLIGLWCMSSLTTQAQDHVYEGSISVNTQAAVEALGAPGGALAGGITKIMGNVTIMGLVTDLSAFNAIDTITGYLKAEGLTRLTALSRSSGSGDYVGLTNLRMVGDYFLVGNFSSRTNSSLDSLGYFPHLDSIGDYFEIRVNESLDAVGSFPVLRSIGGRFRLRDNNQLLHIPDFDGLVQTGKEITIEENDRLITVGSFPRLETIGGDLNFTNNANLTMRGTYPVLRSIRNNFKVDNCDKLQKINNFPSLTTIKGNLEIRNNAVLKSIGNFPVLDSIEGKLEIEYNPALKKIGVFPVLDAIGRNLEIQINDSLSFCCGLSSFLLDENTTISGSTIIQKNAVGCNSKDEIIDGCDPFVELSMDEISIPFFPSETSFILEANTRWQLNKPSSGADWIMMLSDGTTNATDTLMGGMNFTRTQTTVTIHHGRNGSELRMAQLLISFLDETDVVIPADTLTLIQERVMPILELQTPNAVNVGEESDSIELTFFSNTRWRLRKSDPSVNWITTFFVGTTNVMDSLEGGMSGDLTTVNDTTVTVIYDEAPTSASRSTELVLVAINDDDNDNELPTSVNITITQSGISPYPESITLTTQAGVDTIRNTLGRTTAIGGNLIISSTEITHLDSLYFLTGITGNLEIRENSMLEDVGEFSALDSIGGNFLMHSNSILRNAGNFPVLSGIGGYFLIRASDSLTSVGFFPRLATVGGYFAVRGTKILRVLYEFPSLTSIGTGNPYVPSVDALANMSGFPGNTSIVVEQNPSLFYCCGLSRFFSGRSNAASGDVYIGSINNSNLRNSTGCNSKKEVSCDISDQPLTDTLRLPFHTTDTTFIIHSQKRWKLSQDGTEADWITGLSSDGGSTNVTNNLMGDQTASITVTYAQNGTAESRTARLRISFLDTMGNELTSPMPYTLKLIQEEIMPTLQSPSTVIMSHVGGSQKITIRSNNVKWRLRKPDSGADWITMLSVGTTSHTDALTVTNNSFVPTDTVVTITYEKLPISLTDRDALLVLEAVDDEGNVLSSPSSIMITSTQTVLPYPESIILTTQAGVDTIRNTLGRSTAIGGNLTIGTSTDITHLDSLYFLTEITGNLEISNNAMLENVGNFPALDTIGGYFLMHSNAILRNGVDFPVLRHIGRYFLIRASANLTNVGSFPRLITIGESFSVRDNDKMSYLYDFPALTSIGKGSAWVPSQGVSVANTSIVVENNPLLFYCCILTKFRSGGSNPVSGNVFITNNARGCNSGSQTNCNPLLGLSVDSTTVASSSLETSFTLTATTRWRLSKLNSETDWITFFSTENITVQDSLTGGQNDRPTSTSVTINYNQNFISEDFLRERLLVSSIDETGNVLTSPAPDTLTIVRKPNKLYIGNISVSNQADVDALGVSGGALEGNITKIMGNVTISGSVTDLSIFSNIDTITGYLKVEGLTQLDVLNKETSPGSGNYTGFANLKMIGDYFLVGRSSSSSTNSSLESIGNFPHLDSVGGYFQIRNNASLNAVGSFPVLRSIGADFRVQDNDQLLHIPDFDNLIRVGQNFAISSHNGLGTIGSFPKLKTIGGYYEIISNNRLLSLGDFSSLQTITGNYQITSNNRLLSLGDFSSLQTITGNYWITTNDRLVNVGDFSSLQTIGGDYSISSNGRLLSLGDFSSLQTIGDLYNIYSNGRLLSLGDFSSLQTIGGHYQIRSNDSLLSLGDFSSLQTINDDYWIANNDELESIGTFPQLTRIGMSLRIRDNNSLDDCCGLLRLLSGSIITGSTTISGNAEGCNSSTGVCTPFVESSVDEVRVPFFPSETSFILESNTRWQLSKPSSGADWITMLSAGTTPVADNLMGGINSMRTQTTVTLHNAENTPNELRTTKLSIAFLDAAGEVLTSPAPDTLTVIQGTSQRYIGDIVVSTQAALEALKASDQPFESNNNIIHIIEGNVTISGSVTDLSIFNAIDTITGNLQVEGVTDLVALSKETTPGNYEGFTNLRMIGGYFRVSTIDFYNLKALTNMSLDSLGYFPYLDSIGRYLEVTNNPGLQSLGTFSALRSVGNRIRIRNNDNLLHIPDFDNLVRISKKINIEENDRLLTVGSFPKLEEIVFDLSFTNNPQLTTTGSFPLLRSLGTLGISNCDQLRSFSNFPALMRIGSRLVLKDNFSLQSLGNFSSLTTIGGNFQVENNDSLISISTFSNLVDIKGNVELKRNNRLTYIEFLSLDTIDGYLSIQRNRSLITALFGALGKIGGALEVLGNTSLISLEMFPDLMSIGTSKRFVPSLLRESTSVSLLVEDNRNLRSCCVLSSFTGGSGVYINDNFTGCDAVSDITCENRSDFILVTNQSEVDSLSSLGTQLNDVFIVEALGPDDAPITDLSVFNDVTEITGNLLVSGTSNLSAISSANGSSYDGLGSLSVIRGDFLVGNTYTFTNLDSLGVFPSLDSIGGGLIIENTSLEDLEGFPVLVSVVEDFLIDKNKSLMEIGNFSSLTNIGGNLAVRGNGSLEELSKVTESYTGFENLESIGGYFAVSNNYKEGSGNTTGMISIGTFPSLYSIGESFSVINNRVLERLGEFDSLSYIVEYIDVRSNPLLDECCGLPARVIGRASSVNFERNGSSCSSLSREGLSSFSGYTSSCFVGNLVLRNQSEVDNVPSSLTSIRGGLMIGPDFGLDRIEAVSKIRLDSLIIRNVDALRNLREVSFVKVSGTHNLTSLGGLSSLAKVHGNISISSNPEGLSTLGDLSSLDSVGGYLLVHNNGDLEDLGLFSGLLTLPSLLRVSSNPALRSLGDFSSLNNIGGSLVITDNEELLDLGDLSSLAGVGVQDRIYVPSSDSSDGDGFIDGVSIVIENNPELFLCCGLQKLLPLGDNAVSGSVHIRNNGEGCNYAAGQDIGGLGDCRTLVLRSQDEVDGFSRTEVSGNLVIASSSGIGGIKNLDKLIDLTSVSGHLVIRGNKDLSSLVGLSGLSKVGDNFYIQDNTSLSSLRGLTTLDSIGGSFRVRSNPSLLTLDSFPELDNIGGSYSIQDNASLRSLGYSPLLQTIDSMYYVVNNPLLSSLGDYPMLSRIGMSENSVLVPSTDGYQTGVSIVVEDNDLLSNCCVLSGFLSDSSNAVDGTIYLNNNRAECNDETTISTCAELLKASIPDIISAKSTVTRIDIISTTKWLLIKPVMGAEWIRLEDGADNALDTIRGEGDSTFLIFHGTHTGGVIREAVLILEAVNDGGETLTDPPSVMITLRQNSVKTLSVTDNKDRSLTSVSGSAVIVISSNIDWRAEISGEFIDSLQFTPTVGETVVSSLPLRGTITLSGSGNGELSVFYQENIDFNERSSILRLSAYEEGVALTIPFPIDITFTQEIDPPTLNVSSSVNINRITDNTYLINASSSVSTIVLNISIGGSVTGWTALESTDSSEFVTLSGTSGNRMDSTLTLTVTPNNSSNNRSATITIATTGESNANITQTFEIVQLPQGASVPTLSISGEGIMAPTSGSLHTLRVGNSGKMLDISLSIMGGSATGWRVTEEDEQDFVSLPDDMLTGSSNATLTFSIAANSTNTERIATLTFMTVGIVITQTLEITQAAGSVTGSPTLMLTSNNSVEIVSTSTTPIPITFNVGGGATGWSASAGTGSFITLSRGSGEVGTDIMITATPEANTGVERTATITLSTTGEGSVDTTITITQAAGLPTLMLTTPSSVPITSASTAPITITFNVGGGATGWSASTGNTSSFITLSKQSGNVGTGITITATPEANTGAAARTETITLTTMGGTGTAVTATVMITQAGAPLSVSTQIPFTLYPNPTTGKLTIEGISGDVQIYLHDFVGKEVFTSSLTSSRNTIDLSHLPSGMYVITLQREDKTMTEVLIIVN